MENVDGFAEAIRHLIDDFSLTEKIGEYNKRYAKKYEISAILQMLRKVYEIE